MSSGIFLIQSDEKLVEMTQQPYDSEAILQELLAKYPNLLAGDQIDSAAPRKWLLISREFGLASEMDGSDHWSLDHLFLDQDAIPTLVEVKRSANPELRRKVVGQMLDYAANAVVYLPLENIKSRLKETCPDHNADQAVATFLGEGANPEEFWQKVKTNLQAGRVRLLFVADEIPAELRRIVEFLNNQMEQAEVLAVEIKQFVGLGVKAFVPRVIGQTEIKRPLGGRAPRLWDEATFLEELGKRPEGIVETEVAHKIIEAAKKKMPAISWGRGNQVGSFLPGLYVGDIWHSVIAMYTDGKIQFVFGFMRTKAPFDNEAKRRELLDMINVKLGTQFPEISASRFPSMKLTALSDPVRFQAFLSILDWYVKQVQYPRAVVAAVPTEAAH